MPHVCSVCTHPARMTIDDRLEAGHSLRDIAGQYTLTKSGLHRHKVSHIPVAQDVTDLEARLQAAQQTEWIEHEAFGQGPLRVKLRDEYGARMDSLAVEERLRRLREQLLPLWERAQRQVMSTLEALERRHQGPAPLMAIGRVGQVNVAEQQVHVHARSGAPSQPGLAQP